VCPTIVVPGPWTKADIQFQAEQVATQKLHNSGFNCVACQVLILPEIWDQRDEFLHAVKKAIANSPPRGLYYPGADDRIDQFCQRYPGAQVLNGNNGEQRRIVVPIEGNVQKEYAENTEVFAPVLGLISVDGQGAASYLENVIEYCNRQLHGTLGANIIISPKTKRELSGRWDSLIGNLKYGCIAINAWTGLGFLSVQAPWGAFPGHTIDDIQSGTGFVHNTYMFDRVERCVIEAPFRPFPRNLLHGSFTLLPRPPWFVTNKKADKLGMLLTRFQHKPGWLKIPRIFINALMG
jgi:acyl-CoA reductase-like NAD-dependent aldehyde dehydrogenase